MEEVCSALPEKVGLAIEKRRWLFDGLDRIVNRGRRIRTDSILGYWQLHVLAARVSKRRGTLRHAREMTHVRSWLARVVETAGHAFIAFRRLKLTSAIHLTLSVSRLAAVALLSTFVDSPSLLAWALAYSAATLVAAVIALALVRSQLGRASFRITAASLEVGEGFFFSMSTSAPERSRISAASRW